MAVIFARGLLQCDGARKLSFVGLSVEAELRLCKNVPTALKSWRTELCLELENSLSVYITVNLQRPWCEQGADSV